MTLEPAGEPLQRASSLSPPPGGPGSPCCEGLSLQDQPGQASGWPTVLCACACHSQVPQLHQASPDPPTTGGGWALMAVLPGLTAPETPDTSQRLQGPGLLTLLPSDLSKSWRPGSAGIHGQCPEGYPPLPSLWGSPSVLPSTPHFTWGAAPTAAGSAPFLATSGPAGAGGHARLPACDVGSCVREDVLSRLTGGQ